MPLGYNLSGKKTPGYGNFDRYALLYGTGTPQTALQAQMLGQPQPKGAVAGPSAPAAPGPTLQQGPGPGQQQAGLLPPRPSATPQMAGHMQSMAPGIFNGNPDMGFHGPMSEMQRMQRQSQGAGQQLPSQLRGILPMPQAPAPPAPPPAPPQATPPAGPPPGPGEPGRLLPYFQQQAPAAQMSSMGAPDGMPVPQREFAPDAWNEVAPPPLESPAKAASTGSSWESDPRQFEEKFGKARHPNWENWDKAKRDNWKRANYQPAEGATPPAGSTGPGGTAPTGDLNMPRWGDLHESADVGERLNATVNRINDPSVSWWSNPQGAFWMGIDGIPSELPDPRQYDYSVNVSGPTLPTDWDEQIENGAVRKLGRKWSALAQDLKDMELKGQDGGGSQFQQKHNKLTIMESMLAQYGVNMNRTTAPGGGDAGAGGGGGAPGPDAGGDYYLDNEQYAAQNPHQIGGQFELNRNVEPAFIRAQFGHPTDRSPTQAAAAAEALDQWIAAQKGEYNAQLTQNALRQNISDFESDPLFGGMRDQLSSIQGQGMPWDVIRSQSVADSQRSYDQLTRGLSDMAAQSGLPTGSMAGLQHQGAVQQSDNLSRLMGELTRAQAQQERDWAIQNLGLTQNVFGATRGALTDLNREAAAQMSQPINPGAQFLSGLSDSANTLLALDWAEDAYKDQQDQSRLNNYLAMGNSGMDLLGTLGGAWLGAGG